MPAEARGLTLLERGVLAAQQGRVGEGLAQIREACARDPQDAEARAQLARWLARLHRMPEALAAVDEALRLAPVAALTLDTIGVVLSLAGRHEQAAQCFERAVAAAPGRADVRYNLASSLKFLGRFAAADAAYAACLKLDPAHARAHWGRATLHAATPEDNHVAELELLLAQPRDAHAEWLLRHALAKELEDLGREPAAFAQLLAGKARRRASLDYDVQRDLQLFERVMALHEHPLDPPPHGAGVDAPIFVVGLPRTGTTLVERILSSHPAVASAGESQNFAVLLKRAAGTRSPRLLDLETLDRSMSVDFTPLGREYVARTRPDTRPRFVDKMPLNFLYLGHIAQALPGARIVVLRRDPRDAGLSLFRQPFATGFSYYDFALDLQDVARYVAAYERLVPHWRSVLPGRMLELRYESLVAEPERQIRRLLEHCSLDWAPECLDFEQNATPVATASAVQVRRGLTKSGIGRWRRYERELAPMLELFRTLGVECPGPLE